MTLKTHVLWTFVAIFVSLISLSTGLLACSPAGKPSSPHILPKGEGSKSDQGGHDGGGNMEKSTAEEVQREIQFVQSLLQSPSPHNDIYVKFLLEHLWQEPGNYRPASFRVSPERLFPKVFAVEDLEAYFKIENRAVLHSPALQAISQKKWILKEKGDCGSLRERHFDASVSELTLNAEVCFSIEKLRERSPDDLLREILGLVIHEAAHMAGAEEEEAQMWQKEFLKYFKLRYGWLHGNTVQVRTFSTLLKGWGPLMAAGDFSRKNDAQRAAAYLLSYANQLSTLPYLFDPLSMKLAVRPKKPDYFDDYSNAVQAVVEFAVNTVGRPGLSKDNTELPPNPSAQKIGVATHHIFHNLQYAMMAAYSAYTGEVHGPEFPVQCLLPKDPPGTLFQLAQAPPGHLQFPPFLPEKKCKPGTERTKALPQESEVFPPTNPTNENVQPWSDKLPEPPPLPDRK